MEENDQLIGLIVRMAFTHKGCPAIAIREWGRDCDHFESTRAFILSDGTNPRAIYWPTHLMNKLQERELTMEMNSEGPCSMTIISEQEYNEFHPSRRDHLAEKAGY